MVVSSATSESRLTAPLPLELTQCCVDLETLSVAHNVMRLHLLNPCDKAAAAARADILAWRVLGLDHEEDPSLPADASSQKPRDSLAYHSPFDESLPSSTAKRARFVGTPGVSRTATDSTRKRQRSLSGDRSFLHSADKASRVWLR